MSALFLTILYSVVFSWRLFLPQRIGVYDDALVVLHPLYDMWRTGWQTGDHRIYWHEARLFAIRGGQPGTPAMRYELSSTVQVVTFGRARPWPLVGTLSASYSLEHLRRPDECAS